MNINPDKKNVTVRIKSEQSEYGERPMKIEQTADGFLCKSGNDWNLTYKEAKESGLDDTYTTVFFKADGTVSMDRLGFNQMYMEFVEGKRHITRMETPYGILDIGVLTNKVRVRLNENGGMMSLSYAINLNNDYPVETKMTMRITAK